MSNDLPEGIDEDDIEFGFGNTCSEEDFEDAEERYDNE